MADEGQTFGHGAVVFPLTAATTNSLLRDCDPSLYFAIAYFASVLTTHMGARLVAEAAACGATRITSAVAYKLPDDPEAYLTSSQVKFPLLAVYRTREVMADRTLTYRNDTAEWKVVYVLPPLTAGQRERLNPILRAVGRIIDHRCEFKSDTGYLAGAQVFGPSYANLESIRVLTAEYAAWEDGGELTFPAVVLTLEVKERAQPVTGAYDAMTDITTSLDDHVEDETDVTDVVLLDTDTT